MPAIVVPAGGTWLFNHHFSDHNGAKRELKFKNLDEALAELSKLEKAVNLEVDSDWSLYQNLIHCAQSIEFSMEGFPEMKSELFQNTLGSLVFNKFEKQGYMRHNRNEPIPGATPLVEQGDLQLAYSRVKTAIQNFDDFGAPLKPHFAFGKLSKASYEKAHCMHLADHFAMMTYS